MPSNWPSWAARYLGNASARQTPANQENVAAGKLTQPVPLARELAPGRLLVADRFEPDHRLVDLRDALRQQGHDASTGAAAAQRLAPVASSIHRYSEKSSKRSPTAPDVADGRPSAPTAATRSKYATTAGASATFAFSGKKVIWNGPVGPDPGQGQDPVDGTT